MQARALQRAIADGHLRDFAHFVDVVVGTKPHNIGRRHAAVLSPEAFLVAQDALRSRLAPLGDKPHHPMRQAKMLAVGAAKLAIAAGNRTHHYDAVADPHVTHVRAHFDDLA